MNELMNEMVRNSGIYILEGVMKTPEGYIEYFKKTRGDKFFDERKGLEKELISFVGKVKRSRLKESFKGDYMNLVLNTWLLNMWKVKDSVTFALGVFSDISIENTYKDGLEMFFTYRKSPIIKGKMDFFTKRLTTEDINVFKVHKAVKKFHDEMVPLLQEKNEKKAAKSIKSHYESGSWKVYSPKTFEEAVAMSSISNPLNKEHNRKAKWCTAANKRWFNNYKNIFIIKRLPTTADDKGIMVQMAWGDGKSTGDFQWKNEADRNITFKEFNKFRIPKAVLSSIKTPPKSDYKGESLYDLVQTAKGDVKNLKFKVQKHPIKQSKSKEVLGEKDWIVKTYNYKNSTPKMIVKKLEQKLPGMRVRVANANLRAAKNTIDSVKNGLERRIQGGRIPDDLGSSRESTLKVIITRNTNKPKEVYFTVDPISRGFEVIIADHSVYTSRGESGIYKIDLKTKRVVSIAKNEFSKPKYDGFPDEVVAKIGQIDPKKVSDVRKGPKKIGKITGYGTHNDYDVYNIQSKDSLESIFKKKEHFEDAKRNYDWCMENGKKLFAFKKRTGNWLLFSTSKANKGRVIYWKRNSHGSSVTGVYELFGITGYDDEADTKREKLYAELHKLMGITTEKKVEESLVSFMKELLG